MRRLAAGDGERREGWALDYDGAGTVLDDGRTERDMRLRTYPEVSDPLVELAHRAKSVPSVKVMLGAMAQPGCAVGQEIT